MLNGEAFRLGYLLACGNDPVTLADQYRDDIAAFGYTSPLILPGYEPLIVHVAAKHRTKMAAEAVVRGIELPDLASMTLQAIASDDLFGKVLD